MPISTPQSIRVWRLSLGLSQERLARMVGISQAVLSRLECGSITSRHEERVRNLLTKISQLKQSNLD
ncbi:helix-turn-helix transcriptional regulator [Methylobacterium trifolii]